MNKKIICLVILFFLFQFPIIKAEEQKIGIELLGSKWNKFDLNIFINIDDHQKIILIRKGIENWKKAIEIWNRKYPDLKVPDFNFIVYVKNYNYSSNYDVIIEEKEIEIYGLCYTTCRSNIIINAKIIISSKIKPSEIKQCSTHEFGHLLGLGHATNLEREIMASVPSFDFPSTLDLYALYALYILNTKKIIYLPENIPFCPLSLFHLKINTPFSWFKIEEWHEAEEPVILTLGQTIIKENNKIYKFKEWRNEKGEFLSNDLTISFIMPWHNITINLIWENETKIEELNKTIYDQKQTIQKLNETIKQQNIIIENQTNLIKQLQINLTNLRKEKEQLENDLILMNQTINKLKEENKELNLQLNNLTKILNELEKENKNLNLQQQYLKNEVKNLKMILLIISIPFTILLIYLIISKFFKKYNQKIISINPKLLAIFYFSLVFLDFVSTYYFYLKVPLFVEMYELNFLALDFFKNNNIFSLLIIFIFKIAALFYSFKKFGKSTNILIFFCLIIFPLFILNNFLSFYFYPIYYNFYPFIWTIIITIFILALSFFIIFLSYT